MPLNRPLLRAVQKALSRSIGAARVARDRRVFSGLTGEVTVTVYTMSGEKIKVLRKSDGLTDSMTWMPVIAEGDPLASGVYLYSVTSPGHQVKMGKFVVLK